MLSYMRVYKDQVVLVSLNMSGAEQKVSFDLSRNGFSSANETGRDWEDFGQGETW